MEVLVASVKVPGFFFASAVHHSTLLLFHKGIFRSLALRLMRQDTTRLRDDELDHLHGMD